MPYVAPRALVVSLLMLAACRVVDPHQVDVFACTNGACPQGLTCCTDSLCRPACPGSGADGGIEDAGVPCNATTCADGCCAGEQCIRTFTSSQCGVGGATCQRCPNGEACVDGACEGCLQTCATGCCIGSDCERRTVQACAPAGEACGSCGLTGDACGTTGFCQCGSHPACATGQRCVGGSCTCDATSCPEGCCTSAGACLHPNEQSGALCGSGGAACQGCDGPPDATCSSASERTAYRSPGACVAGACQYATHSMPCAFGCESGACTGDACQGCLVPPRPTCFGDIRHGFDSPGSCGPTGCNYRQVDTRCLFGCSNGACNPDPCLGVRCEQPPAPRCQGTISVSATRQGTCSQGTCTYETIQTTCPFGCDETTGACKQDPCSSVRCDHAPAATCSGASRRGFVAPGACILGSCSYPPQDLTCTQGCTDGRCNGADPCVGITCDSPPSAICLDGTTRRTFAAMGTCSIDGCAYPPVDSSCPFGCSDGNCRADPCQGIACSTPPGPTCAGNRVRTFGTSGTCAGGGCSYPVTESACTTPPAAVCLDGTTQRSYAPAGTCTSGACVYAPSDRVCPSGCTNGACDADPCANMTCTDAPAASCVDTTTLRTFGNPGTCGNGTCAYPVSERRCNAPPAATCLDGTTLKTWLADGRCTAGACTYTSMETTCAMGCSQGACVGDPCAGVSCTTPPSASCADAQTRRTFAASGVCSAGQCTYATTDAPCATPPAATCLDGNSVRTYSSTGSCTNGVCQYAPTDSACPFGCSAGRCAADPCGGMTCTSAPRADCPTSSTRRSWTAPGTCSNGTCTFPSSTEACTTPPGATCAGNNAVRTFGASGTCNDGACQYPPIDTPCDQPPAPTCVDATTSRTYASMGTCSGAACQYASGDQTCQFGCSGGLCTGDPCAGMTCNSPPASTCTDATHLRVFSATGTCSGGTCSYTSMDSTCLIGCSNGACLPCNSTTCADGCCSLNRCYDNETTCRGRNGNVCGAGCTNGKTCYDGFCSYAPP